MTIQDPTRDTSFDTIKSSHSLHGDRDKLTTFYRSWVRTYDADVDAQDYRGPGIIADIVAHTADNLVPRPRHVLQVLDGGCGTGLVGNALSERGFRCIDGFDLSHQMIAAADLTGSYRTLRGGVDMNCPLDPTFQPGTYDVAVCCGVFTVGHVADDSLHQLVMAVRPGGAVVVSTRDSYLRESGFAQYVGHLAAAGRVRVHDQHNAAYIDEEGARYWVLQIC